MPSPLPSSPDLLVDDLTAELEALSLWTAARHRTAARAARPGLTREARLDGAREVEVRDRELEVFLARLDAQDARPWGGASAGPVAVVAHRHEWLRRQVVRGLAEHGIEVLVETDNGADVVGVVLADRPALVLVDELLAMRTGVDTVRELCALSPDTPVAATVTYDDGVAVMLDAGAGQVFTRRVPPATLVGELVAMATGAHPPLVARQRPADRMAATSPAG